MENATERRYIVYIIYVRMRCRMEMLHKMYLTNVL
jgi:hypothetical protein